MFILKKVRIGLLLALAATISGAFQTVITRYVLTNGENPLNITAWLFIFMIIPWLYIFQKHQKEFRQLPGKDILLLIFIGIAGSVGINFMYSLALANSQAITFSFVYRTVVVFTILFAWIFFKEKLSARKWFVVLLIVTGSYLITSKGEGLQFTPGDIYSLVMAASVALINNILIKHSVSKMHPDLTGAVITVISFISFVGFAVITHLLTVPKNFLLVFCASAFNFGLIILRNRAFKVATASLVTMTFALSPLFVGGLSVLFLQESFGPVELMGGALILSSTLLAERFKL